MSRRAPSQCGPAWFLLRLCSMLCCWVAIAGCALTPVRIAVCALDLTVVGFWAILRYPTTPRQSDARRRVAIERRKPCDNPNDSSDMPKYLPAGLTQCVLNNFPKKSPPYHVPQDNVSAPLQRLEVEITGHQSVRGRSGVIAVLRKTQWVGLSQPSFEREMDLQLFALTFCVIGPAFRTNTVKPTAFTAGCALARHGVSFPETTAFLGTRLRLRPTRGVASPLPRHNAPQGSPLLVQG